MVCPQHLRAFLFGFKRRPEDKFIIIRKIFVCLGFSKGLLSDTSFFMSGQSEEKIYKIGQAAKLVGLKSYVLRFWEGEFEQLEPIRTESGQRLYNDGHIALIRRIKTLLHYEGLTIEGARKRLDSPEDEQKECTQMLAGSASGAVSQLPLFSSECDSYGHEKELLKEIRAELRELKKLLS